MKHLHPTRFLSFLLSFSLMIAPLPLSAMIEYLVIPIADLQAELAIPETDRSYVYLGKELSNIGYVLSAISNLDKNHHSPLLQLKDYIEKGLFLARHDDIADILQYAEHILHTHYTSLDPRKAEQLYADLDCVIQQFMNGSLSVKISKEHDDNNTQRSYINIITVQGLLSVNDQVVQNITAIDLSATDAIIQNATISFLSTSDQIIQSVSITNLSVMDETVTDMLSVNDEVVKNNLYFTDNSGTKFVGLTAPTSVSSNYTLALPATAPTANQVLQANATTPTNLQWLTLGGTIVPAISRTIYVAQYGNDITGNGSSESPYASLSQAINVANTLANVNAPICIFMYPGNYIEDNSAGPLTITTDGISIVGFSPEATYIFPSTPANDFILANGTIRIANVAIESTSALATGLSLAVGNLSTFDNVRFANFLTGVACSGGVNQLYGFNACTFVANGTGLSVDTCRAETIGCDFFGVFSISATAANTAISITGSGANLVISGGAIAKCDTGFNIANNSTITISSVAFKFNTTDIIQNGASNMVLNGATFELTNSNTDVDIQISGAGTNAEIVGCQFDGNNDLGVTQATAISVTNNASASISSGSITNYTTAIQVGTSSDTSSTIAYVSGVTIQNCTNDILQEGSSTLNFDGGSASNNKITINNPTNVNLAFFDLANNGALTIGSTANQNTRLIQIDIDPTNQPELNYLSSLYSTQAVGFENDFGGASTLYALSANNTDVTAITTDRTKIAGLRLVSDEGSPVGGTSALRGWDINKNGSTAQLSFIYQNSDVVGQSSISPYVVMQLDGVNNQLQLPNASTQIVFDGDTNLYRSAANVLKTDDNFIVGTLTPGHVVITDPTTNQLSSSVTTSTEVSYVSGVTSAIQTQLNGKVSKAGDTMTGTLTLPAGTAAVPSLQFTGSTNTGLSAATANVLSFDISGTEQINISSSGLTIDGFTTAGVVHNNAAGLLTSSLIVNADIDPAAAIADTKLATISTAGKVANSATTATNTNTPSAIVARDSSGNFSAGTITANLNGNATTATTATNFSGSFSGDVTGTQSATVVSFVGGQSAANVAAATVLANAATSADTASTIVKRTASGGFSAGAISVTDTVISNTATITPFNTAGVVHNDATGLLSSSLIVNADIDPAAAIADSKLATISTAGKVANSATTATNTNTPSAIVARDSSGNFAAGTITANLSGNATTATTATNFSGSLSGDVTGTQTATVVSTVGGQSAANVAAATVLANAATSADTASTIVKRSSSGGFSAGAISITDEVITNTATITPFNTAGVVHNDATGLLSSSLIVNADISSSAAITDSKLATISTAGKVANSATTATSTNTASAIVARDSSGNFSAGTITANLSGNATTATTATTATNFSGSLSGDVTGTQSATVVSTVGGQTAANVAAATVLANAATSANTANAIVKRTASGGFSAGAISITDTVISNSATITPFSTAGVVHNDATGLLSSSLIVDADITTATITNDKLANISSTNIPGDIVVRDNSGNFATNMITIAGTTTNNTDVATKAYVDSAISTGLVAKNPAIVVSTTDIGSPPAGLQTIDGVTLSTNDRVLLVGQTNQVQNGLWLAQTGNWTRPTDFASGTQAGQAYVLILEGATEGGSSWLCNTPTAIIDTDPITFALFSLPNATTGANVGAGTGLIFRNTTGNTLNFKSLIAGSHINITNNANDITIATDGTSANTVSTLVARDSSGNFSAGTITATLSGNATTATTATNFSGSLSGDVTGTQSATVVSTVGGQTAANVAAATVLANAATSANTASTIVKRTASGGFSAGAISITDTVISNTATITPFSTAGVVHNDATGLLSSSLIVNADISSSAAIADSKLATISTAGKVANSATTATSANTASAIVARDASGNFAAGTITANLSGNATTATTATNFSGSLSGDVTGTQGATVVSFVGGQSAANVAAATVLANAATNLNTPSTIVERDANGSFAAGLISITDEVISNTATITPFNTAGVVHNSASGLLSSSLIVNADISSSAAIADSKLATISTAGKVANSATTATSANTASAIVARDASGNFSAGTITANLTGNATTATTATNFSGSLSGDVTGTQTATVVSTVGGQTAANVAAATVLANAATNLNTPSTIVKRDANGSFAAGLISVTDTVISNTATITPFNTAGVIHNNASGLLSSSLIVNADISSSAAITDNKLATISTAGKVANSATTATSANTASAIVARDASGNFSAGTITANLTGNVTGNVTGHASQDLALTGGTLTGTLTLPAGTAAAPSLQFTGSTNTGLSAATANVLSFDISGAEQMNLSASGLTLDGFTTAGVVHNSAAGLLISSLIVAADITAATITNDKLANISSSNVPNDIVVRDSSGNFAAGTISANLIGSVTGHASLDLPLTGGTLTGALQLPAGTTSLPSLVFTGSTTTGLSASAGALSFSTSGAEQLKISSGGTISIDAFMSAGVVHNDASGNLSSSLIVNSDISSSAGITDSKLATISTAGKVANSATTATSANTANAIVARDASGNFSAGTITANLSGNATTATTATNFSGSLTGDVTGTQSATVVSTVGGQTAANVAAATVLANAATSSNTASTIVKRDASGNFSAGTITANLSGNATTATTATNFTGSLSGDVTGTQSATVVSFVGGQTAANVAAATVLANNATNLNTANTIVKRDGTGSFAAQEISMNDGILAGNLILSTEPSTSTTGNILKGSSSFIHDFGTNNTFVGINAGNFTMTGTTNVGIGTSALIANTTGASNTAVGFNALTANTTGTQNTGIGNRALVATTIGVQNTAVGFNVMVGNTTGTNNTAVGRAALAGNVTGSNNTVIGTNAMQNGTTGSSNTAIGVGALQNNSADSNTALGVSTLNANTTGTGNTAVGSNALIANTIGINNTAVGSGALDANTTGTNNTAVGINALGSNTTGSNNTALGSAALATNATGIQNIAIGENALTNNTANFNVAVGSLSLQTNTTGAENVGLGGSSLALNTIGSNNTAIGSSCLAANTTGSSNVGVGRRSLFVNTIGSSNVALGLSSLGANTTGNNNTALGTSTLLLVTTGSNNIAIGNTAGGILTTGSGNIYIDADAGSASEAATIRIGTSETACYIQGIFGASTPTGTPALVAVDSTGKLGTSTISTSSANVANAIVLRSSSGGFSAGAVSMTDAVISGNLTLTTEPSTSSAGIIFKSSNTFIHDFGTQNTFVGISAGNLTMSGGGENTALGYNALTGNTTGVDNTAVGWKTLPANTIGANNTAMGAGALNTNTTGNNNTAIGSSALAGNIIGINNTAIGNSALLGCTGSNNIAIGASAGASLFGGSNNIYIGTNSASGIESNVTKIANIRGVTTVNANAIAVLIDSAGQLGTTPSSRSVKHNIEDMNDQSENIYQLRPVTFAYNCDATETKQYGLIAEEVNEVFPTIVANDNNGQPESVQYHVLPVLLLNEIQKQHTIITDLQKKCEQVDLLSAMVEQFEQRIKDLEKRVLCP